MSVSTTIYVGNLSYSTETATMGNFFTKFGQVKTARIITTVFRGEKRSRGFGFVEYETEAGFKAAVDNKEPIEIDGRKIRVVPAKEKRKSKTAFLNRLPDQATEETIKAQFKDYKITDFRMKTSRTTKQRFCFIEFETPEMLTDILNNHRKFELGGATLIVKIARPLIRRFPSRRWGPGRYKRSARKAKASTAAPNEPQPKKE
ncbi:hypothetical protein TVAG_043470 [Trichomonas vaginalis G3]|uniref:RRM domain-containing protein n=1 Tax=Trichomonas vaginalis (strain ATCC PRA-98 / G3) TaxID=412133 RepID=A2EV87_TRIV3|nr:poly(U) RNA binding [Trichomonas vaginalis G3]EAY03401.1 hypothetical protein TVAG_043470 [Trichomonas vaginalis G3]KAI5540181.1 poly(U) RNA binding [Trichomonas vaginalis G3]|eukprot:XP_001315624.1 hypothetical protein [Trichomonas vaginalis G3]